MILTHCSVECLMLRFSKQHLCQSVWLGQPTRPHEEHWDCSHVFIFHSLPWTFYTTEPLCPYVFFFSGFYLSAWTEEPFHSPLFYLSLPSTCPPAPFLLLARSLSLSLVIAVYGSVKEWVPGTGLSLLLANASRLVSLCKYLHRGIMDGPTHFEVELHSASSHIRAKNDTKCDLERRWSDVTQHDITWHGRNFFWRSAGSDLLFLSVFSEQAPSSDLALKHVDTMVSFFFFLSFFFTLCSLFILRSSHLFCLG